MNSFQFDDVQSSISSFLAVMMWGIAIGEIAAIFLTPRRGSELRVQVADSMNRASRRAMDTYNRASGTVNDMAGRAADLAENLADRAAVLTKKLNQARQSTTVS